MLARMPVKNVNGVQMAYDEDGTGPPLLLLHAGITDRRMWDDCAPDLARRFRVIRPDLRGYGETPIPGDRFCWTDDVRELLDVLGIERTHVVGVSISAGIALDLVLAHPERVDHLVIVAAGLRDWKYNAEMDANDAAEAAALRAGDLDEAAWVNVRAWLDGPMRTPEQVDPALRQRVFEMQRHAFEIDNDQAELYWLIPDVRQRLSEISVPTLVLVGDLDQDDMRRIAPVLADEIPGARYVEMPGVAHLPPMEDPRALTAAVLKFLPAPVG